MSFRLLYVLFVLSFSGSLNADVTLRFHGRDVKERLEINYWLSQQKKCPQAIMAVGLKMLHEVLNVKQFADLKEGVSITIPGKFAAHCPSSILTLDNARSQFMLEDGCTYAILLRDFARSDEKLLENVANKDAHQAKFCAVLLSRKNS